MSGNGVLDSIAGPIGRNLCVGLFEPMSLKKRETRLLTNEPLSEVRQCFASPPLPLLSPLTFFPRTFSATVLGNDAASASTKSIHFLLIMIVSITYGLLPSKEQQGPMVVASGDRKLPMHHNKNEHQAWKNETQKARVNQLFTMIGTSWLESFEHQNFPRDFR
eukprot:scaffold31831_cov168-Amphora_coffeaeformis.AAC.1